MSAYDNEVHDSVMAVSNGFAERQDNHGGVIDAVCRLFASDEAEDITSFFEDEFLEDARQPDPTFWRHERQVELEGATEFVEFDDDDDDDDSELVTQ